MPVVMFVLNMELGTLIEYIDRKKVICAVIMQAKKQKVRLLTQANREVSVSEHRLFCVSGRLDPEIGRDRLVDLLSETSARREALKAQVNVYDLWEVVHEEEQWIDAETMAGLAFGISPEPDHVSAVIRAFFNDRVYFKFDVTRFLPHSPEKVEQIQIQEQEMARRAAVVQEGGEWLRRVYGQESPEVPPDKEQFVSIMRSLYLFEKDSPTYDLGRQMVQAAGIDPNNGLFEFLIRLGVWDEHANLDLYRMDVPIDFPREISQEANALANGSGFRTDTSQRRDFTGLPVLTIDGQATLDYDDALSLEMDGDYFRVGIHISDVSHYVERGSLLDQEAFARSSSIYMPDDKIPMFPPLLAEGLLSLKADQVRPAISVMVRLDRDAVVLDYEICPSLVRVRRQLTYHEVNMMADDDKEIIALSGLAEKLREKRLDDGAVLISLPEINIWLDEEKNVTLHKVNRESRSRILVSEFMILANRLMASFLADHGSPAVFRAQPEPRLRLFDRDNGTLYQNWMQRRHLSRFILCPKPEPHSGLGVDAYVTATSPIRKYFDLAVQRQIRGVLGLDKKYTQTEVENIIANSEVPLSKVSRVQFVRNRYWILKYLETKLGKTEPGMILERRKDRFVALLTDCLVECTLPVASDPSLAPQDAVQLRIVKVDPREQFLAVELA
ncbi:Exoribonuclease II [Desulfatibacillum aliphaticivorans]|uniref:Exoribonuclease II n=2 Tax=Desulfatibacillum aliphaticivorans TaxID=218208 RepID=B8FGU6_DESAL|nr:Exoribonuclease II [Desulfatibacillum aliphaticivorans]